MKTTVGKINDKLASAEPVPGSPTLAGWDGIYVPAAERLSPAFQQGAIKGSLWIYTQDPQTTNVIKRAKGD